ncbi:MAG: hypothetical protein KKG09_09570 [Verrucomicrobia bacterium]|nr:hypothetical protein [Verrucomicrobiota bacterium]MBU4290262.1 hypothetical protein [Verrucomicrobiota bacterium]MBU4498237.1 hypothetical protein [Verrucomicrobiota bacterium]MCG2679979.1 hypothetical protein [Kiritimatiellia bacterium]
MNITIAKTASTVVRIAADESAHSVQDAKTRIDMGYNAIALKPIAKTMSMSLRGTRPWPPDCPVCRA